MESKSDYVLVNNQFLSIPYCMMCNCIIPINTLVIIGERKRVKGRERELKLDRREIQR